MHKNKFMANIILNMKRSCHQTPTDKISHLNTIYIPSHLLIQQDPCFFCRVSNGESYNQFTEVKSKYELTFSVQYSVLMIWSGISLRHVQTIPQGAVWLQVFVPTSQEHTVWPINFLKIEISWSDESGLVCWLKRKPAATSGPLWNSLDMAALHVQAGPCRAISYMVCFTVVLERLCFCFTRLNSINAEKSRQIVLSWPQQVTVTSLCGFRRGNVEQSRSAGHRSVTLSSKTQHKITEQQFWVILRIGWVNIWLTI